MSDQCDPTRQGLHEELTFERALSGTRDHDVKVSQVVLMRSGTDSWRWVSDEPFGLLQVNTSIDAQFIVVDSHGRESKLALTLQRY